MILINEWLPNPTGSDATGEWVELFNAGTAAQDISGWKLTSGAKGKFVFPKTTIQGGEYLVVYRKDSKLTLRNTDETVSLYDASGKQVDSSSYVGTAPEGKSYSRTGQEDPVRSFLFAAPTPGAANTTSEVGAFIENTYPVGVPLGGTMSTGGIILLALAGAAVLASLVFYVAKTNDYLKDLFFGKY